MSKNKRSPILVVGAGVTGLMLGCVLRRYGTSVRIIDKLPGILPYARAIGLHSRTLEAFHDLGIVDKFLDQGQKISAYHQFAGGKPCQSVRYDEFDGRFPYQIALEQWKTEGLLEACLGDLGATVERETELVSIEERLDGVRATLRLPDGSTEVVDAPWLVGCDGAHSTIRHLNRQHFPGEADPRQYMIADVVLENRPADDETHAYLSGAGVLFLGCLPEGRNIVFGNFDELHDGRTEKPTLSDVQALLDTRGPGGITAREPRWMSWYRTHYRLTPHYRHGRTFLAGDAAHIHSSVGGLGMNTGIQDAYNLGWKLALVSQGLAPESLLDSYESERRAVGEDVVASTKKMSEQALAYAGLDEAARDRLYRYAVIPDADRLRRLRHLAALDLDYRKSPVCMEYRHSPDDGAEADGALHAGAEAVDAGPLEVDGRQLTAFDLFAGPHVTLLLFAGTEEHGRRLAHAVELAGEVVRVYGDLIRVCMVLPADAEPAAFEGAPATIVRDLGGTMHERYGAHAGRTFFIRPDGYVGWCSERPSLAALRDYLAKVFVCP